MSQLHDLLGIIKGARQVLKESVKLQQEHSRLLWNNSSIRPFLNNWPFISVSIKVDEESARDVIEGIYIVGHSLKRYVYTKYNIGYKPAISEKLKEEIDELNKEFKTLNNVQDNIILSTERFDKSVTSLEKIKIQDFIKTSSEDVNTKIKSTSNEDFTINDFAHPVANKKFKTNLNSKSKERVVPSSRIGRMVSFGSLAAGLGVGTVAQYARNTIQSFNGKTHSSNNVFLSAANAERIVDTLCKVRGAALKLGQLLSIQDENVLSPEFQKIFERVRQSADFMPKRQVEKVMSSQFGCDWRSRLRYFDDKPFAAASIGQVHYAVLLDGRQVAIKVQYPGVAKGISSDIDNLVGILKVWNIFPKGMFIDNIVDVAKKELAWEVDYVREAECTKKFKRLLAPFEEYFVPDVIEDFCTRNVFTTELIEGTPVDKFFEAPYEIRYDIARKIMRLCLLEMFVLRCMQTDPNWGNFFYNIASKQFILLDFGATREYSKKFMDQYIEIIKAASDGDRNAILRMSREMNFLTGYESKVMEQSHVDTVMIMGEVFTDKGSGEFDFGSQKTTQRILELVPTILSQRLCPPPEEIYSLHRKLSGVFLLCSKLKIRMNCGEMFREVYDRYKINKTQKLL